MSILIIFQKTLKRALKIVKIDILIVVNMFLTGFDSKVLNTLYVDKNLMYHDLFKRIHVQIGLKKNQSHLVKL